MNIFIIKETFVKNKIQRNRIERKKTFDFSSLFF